MQIDARLRQGDSHAAIGRDYNVSVDAVDRHASKHLDAKPKVAQDESSLTAKWVTLYQRAEAIFESTSVQGDSRGALAALARCAEALESSIRLQPKVGFEALSKQQQAEWVVRDRDLLQKVLDFLVAPVSKGLDFNSFVEKCQLEIDEQTTDVSRTPASRSL